MHESVMKWVGRQVVEKQLAGCSVLEIGAADVNGSVRSFFTGPYVGCDLVAGPGVDLVVPTGEIPLPDGSFDVVVSTEALEHDLRPWRTLAEAYRLLRPGGRLLLSCRGFNERGSFPFHNPPDRWRFSHDAVRLLAEDAGFKVEHLYADPQVVGWFLSAVVPLGEPATT